MNPASKNRLLLICISLLSLVYVANCFAPLRLTNDTVRYFALMEKWDDTWPANLPVPKDILPYGYVYFLIALSKLNILSPMGIVFFQCMYLAGALFFLNGMFKKAVNIPTLLLFVLLNWLTIKLVVLPLSEMQYLFFSFGTLYHLEQFESTNKKKYLLYTGLFCAASIFTRTVGVALVPALALTLILKNRSSLKNWCNKNKLLSFLIPSVLMVAVLSFLFTSAYFDFVWKPLYVDPLHFIANSFWIHLIDWSEVFVNIPYSKVSAYIPLLPYKVLYISTGVGFLAVLLNGLWKRKYAASLHVKLYLLIYLAVIFNWPFFDSRFWFPVLPIIFALLLQNKENRIIKIYKAVYVITGIFALSYYCYLSFDRQALSNRHDAGKWKAAYEAVFFQQPYDSAKIDKRAVYILNKYN